MITGLLFAVTAVYSQQKVLSAGKAQQFFAEGKMLLEEKKI